MASALPTWPSPSRRAAARAAPSRAASARTRGVARRLGAVGRHQGAGEEDLRLPGVARLGAAELGGGVAQVGGGVLPLADPPAGGEPLYPRPFEEDVGVRGVEPQRLIERGAGLGEGGPGVLALAEQGLGEAPPGVAQVVGRRRIVRLQLDGALVAVGGAVERLPRVAAGR